MVKLKDIYVASGQPKITYASRDRIEKKLKRCLYEGGKIVYLIGPTKIGKSVLAIHLTQDRHRIFIPGGSIKSLEDFYLYIYDELMLPIEESFTEESGIQKGWSITTGLRAKLGALIGEVESSTSINTENINSNKDTSTKRYINLLASKLRNFVIDNEITIVLDDLHYIDAKVQKDIFQVLKSWLSPNNCIIVTAVSHRESDPIENVPEIKGRIEVIEVENWSPEELTSIIEAGNRALNISFSKELKERILFESYLSPLLVQQICFDICFDKGILFDSEYEIQVNMNAVEIETLFKDMASRQGKENVMNALTKGPDPKGSPRNQYTFYDGIERDIYESIRYALKALATVNAISSESITEYIYLNMDESNSVTQSYLKSSVTKSLEYMHNIAKSHGVQNKSQPVIDFYKQRNELYILDPFFAFQLKWLA